MRTLYLDCFSGVSGDMLISGFLDLGLSLTELQSCIDGLNLQAVLKQEEVVCPYAVDSVTEDIRSSGLMYSSQMACV